MNMNIDETHCNACGESWPEDCIVRASEANTGGDTICYRCHTECVPEDAPALADGVERCVNLGRIRC